MNAKESIEAMKQVLIAYAVKNNLCFSFETMRRHAEALYKAGYRKRGEVVSELIQFIEKKDKAAGKYSIYSKLLLDLKERFEASDED